MSGLTDGDVVREFRDLGIEVKLGSSVLDKSEFQAFTWALFGMNFLSLSPPPPAPSVQDVGLQYHLEAAQLCEEWVAYSAQHGDCELADENIEKWENVLHIKSKQTPTSRRAVSKTKSRRDGWTMYSKEDLDDL